MASGVPILDRVSRLLYLLYIHSNHRPFNMHASLRCELLEELLDRSSHLHDMLATRTGHAYTGIVFFGVFFLLFLKKG